MKTIKEMRKLFTCDIRALCVAENWYTNGTNEEYAKLLDMANDVDIRNAETLYEIALNIYEHSEYHPYGDKNDDITNIMFCIAQKCPSTYEIIDNA